MCKIYLKLMTMIPQQGHGRRSGLFIGDLERFHTFL